MKSRSRGKIVLQEIKPFHTGGIALLSIGRQPDGTRLVRRELLRPYMLNLRMHSGFVRGTKIRELLSPHPHIVFSIERGYKGFIPYEVIEYVPGHNLRELIAVNPALVRKEAFHIIKQTATALAYMHQHQILHLDIKADNILVNTLTNPPTAKITDFDLSRDLKCHHNQHRSGTLNYMPPEELSGGQISVSTDVFAFGVLAYYVVTGQLPFSPEQQQERSRQTARETEKLPSARRVNPDIMPKLDWIISKCLEADPGQRFPSMSYMCQELNKL